MLNNTIIVSIQNPCQAKWHEMQPQNNGKFCMQCSKKVIDFTGLSNKEIVDILENSKGKLCGRFNVSQLNKELTNNKTSKNNNVFKGFVSIFLLGSIGSAFATQNTGFRTETLNVLEDQSIENKPNIKQITNDTLKNIIKGQVLNEFEEPIPNALITVEELSITTTSDSEGNFTINLPEDFSADYVTLNINSDFYLSYSEKIFKMNLPVEKKFFLTQEIEEVILMGDIMIVEKPKWWQFWKRF